MHFFMQDEGLPPDVAGPRKRAAPDAGPDQATGPPVPSSPDQASTQGTPREGAERRERAAPDDSGTAES